MSEISVGFHQTSNYSISAYFSASFFIFFLFSYSIELQISRFSVLYYKDHKNIGLFLLRKFGQICKGLSDLETNLKELVL